MRTINHNRNACMLARGPHLLPPPGCHSPIHSVRTGVPPPLNCTPHPLHTLSQGAHQVSFLHTEPTRPSTLLPWLPQGRQSRLAAAGGQPVHCPQCSLQACAGSHPWRATLLRGMDDGGQPCRPLQRFRLTTCSASHPWEPVRQTTRAALADR